MFLMTSLFCISFNVALVNSRVENKSIQLAYGIDMMFRDILPNLAHESDGLIFTSLDGEYVCGTDRHMYAPLPLYLSID